MAAMKGLYLAPELPSVAYDLSAAKTVLSIGAPLLDGWGTPANVFAARRNFRLIQAEAVESRTAVLADEWIRLAPGTEAAFLPIHPEPSVCRRDLRWSSAMLPKSSKSIGGSAPSARPYSPAPKRPCRNRGRGRRPPSPASPACRTTRSRVLLIDESSAVQYIPWHQIERKLVRENPVVVTFAATRGGYARHAQYALPTAVYPEVIDDIAPAVDTVHPTFRISVPLVAPPAGLANPAEFAGALAGIDASNALRERADAIHQSAKGPYSPMRTKRKRP